MVCGKDIVIPPTDSVNPVACRLSTDLKLNLPADVYGEVKTCNSRILLSSGVIDRSYSGNLGLVAYNLNQNPIRIPKGSVSCWLTFKKIGIECVNLSDVDHEVEFEYVQDNDVRQGSRLDKVEKLMELFWRDCLF